MTDPHDPDWKCPQNGCDKPLSQHLVTLASMNAHRRQPDPKEHKKP